MIACREGLDNGGLAGMFWSYIWTFVGFTFVEMSLAEMASMSVYHWKQSAGSLSDVWLQGSNFGRPVPLGLGICTTKVPAIPLVCGRLDVHAFVASRQCRRLLPCGYHCTGVNLSEQPWLRASAMGRHVARRRYGMLCIICVENRH